MYHMPAFADNPAAVYTLFCCLGDHTITSRHLAADYAAFAEQHGREPTLLKCSQAAYIGTVLPECHTDFDTGADIRYQNAVVVVADVDGWIFE